LGAAQITMSSSLEIRMTVAEVFLKSFLILIIHFIHKSIKNMEELFEKNWL
jgi:hypothetical protein